MDAAQAVFVSGALGALIVGGFGIYGRRASARADNTNVEALSRVNEALQNEVERLTKVRETLELAAAKAELSSREEMRKLTERISGLEDENYRLLRRLDALEYKANGGTTPR